MVNKYGLIGVIFGTLFATIFRGLEFLIFVCKNLLERSCWVSIKKIIISIITVFIIYYLGYTYMFNNIDSYFHWLLYGIITLIVSLVITIGLNALLNLKELKNAFVFLKEVKKWKFVFL